MNHDQIIADTTLWLERAVIGLNLCPFAKAVHVKGRIRFAVTDATTTSALLDVLKDELARLSEARPDDIDTTLLIHPGVLDDFLDYNAFLDEADNLLTALALDGVLQIASFHPQYQFAGTAPDDIENFTNRSPYPILHLLRESSIDVAVEAYPDVSDIYEKNMETLRRLGTAGWRAMRIPNASDTSDHD